MRLLLDTHTALWMYAGSKAISPELERDLTDPANDLFFSDASAWEIVIKDALGKLALPSPPEVFIPSLVAQHGMTRLPISWESIFEWGRLPMLHRDPFDRLLIAQANCEACSLVSRDPEICQYRVAIHWK